MVNYANKTVAAVQDKLQLTFRGFRFAYLDIQGTFVGTISFEGTVDGTNWFAINNKAASPASSATAAGQHQFDQPGLLEIRARCSAYTSGTPILVMGAVGDQD